MHTVVVPFGKERRQQVREIGDTSNIFVFVRMSLGLAFVSVMKQNKKNSLVKKKAFAYAKNRVLESYWLATPLDEFREFFFLLGGFLIL
jgi:hypothetical protein